MSITRLLGVAPLLILIGSLDLAAQDRAGETIADSLDLSDLLEVVSSENPDLRAIRLEAEVLSTRRSQVTALPDPRLGITYQPYPLFTARGAQRTQWRVEQAIPFPGKLPLKGEIADYGAEIALYEALTFEQDMLYEAKVAYYDLYRVQQQENLIRAFQERLRDFEGNAAMQYVVGTGLQQAILKAQLERNSLIQRRLSLNLQRRSAIEKMSRLANRSLVNVETGNVLPPPLPEYDEKALLEIALSIRPEVKALRAADNRSDAEIALAEKAFLPDFGVHVTYFDVSPADIPPTATGRDALGFGISVTIPVWRQSLKAQLTEARLRKSQISTRLESLDYTFKTQIADLVSQLEKEREQMVLFREALIPQAETSLQATLAAYTTGRTDFLDLLDAERMLFSLQSGLEDAVARYLKAAAALERALGVLSLSDLETL